MLSDVSEFENYENLVVGFFIFSHKYSKKFCIICELNEHSNILKRQNY